MPRHPVLSTFLLLGVLQCAPGSSRNGGEVTVRGRVVAGPDSHPLNGARVTDIDVMSAASADSLGVFVLRTRRPSDGRLHLLVRFIGYKAAPIDVAADSAQDLGTISLQPEQVHVDDLIVTSPSRKRPK